MSAGASWFFLHLGNYKDRLHPEEASAKIADDFLNTIRVKEETIHRIKNAFLQQKTIMS